MENAKAKEVATENWTLLIGLIKQIGRNKKFFILAAFLGLSLGIFYAIIKKPEYTAAITFSLQEEGKLGGGGLLSLASSFGLDAGGSSELFSGDNIEQVFKSRKMIEKTLLEKYPNSNKTFGDIYIDILNIRQKINLPQPFLYKSQPDAILNRQQDSVINSVHKYVNLGYLNATKPDKKFDIYEVSFKCTDEVFSKYFVEELVRQVASFYTITKTKKAKKNVDVLQRRVDSIHGAIGVLVYQKAASADANVNPIFQRSKVNEQKKQIDMTALGAGYGELLKNLELARYSLLKETPLFQIIDEPILPLKKKTFSIALYGLIGVLFFMFLAIIFLIIINFYGKLTGMLK